MAVVVDLVGLRLVGVLFLDDGGQIVLFLLLRSVTLFHGPFKFVELGLLVGEGLLDARHSTQEALDGRGRQRVDKPWQPLLQLVVEVPQGLSSEVAAKVLDAHGLDEDDAEDGRAPPPTPAHQGQGHQHDFNVVLELDDLDRVVLDHLHDGLEKANNWRIWVLPVDVVEPFASVDVGPEEEHEVDKKAHLPVGQYEGQKPNRVHRFLVRQAQARERVFLPSVLHLALGQRAAIGKEEEDEGGELGTQRESQHVQQVEEVLQVAQPRLRRPLRLKDLPQRQDRAHVLANVEEVVLLVFGVEREARLQALVHIHFEVFALDLFDLLGLGDVLHVLGLEGCPSLVQLPVVVDVVNEVAALAREPQLALTLSLLVFHALLRTFSILVLCHN